MIVENKRYCDECNSDNAQRYDSNYKVYTELINRLEDVKGAIKKQNYGIAMDILCKPYPEFQITASIELKESENERIRKELIHYFSDGVEFLSLCSFSREDILAWLEKQDPKKLEEQLDKMIEADLSWLKKQDEQKPAEWSEEDEEYLNFVIAAMKTLQVKCTENEIKHNSNSQAAPYYAKVINWLKSLKPQSKQKWSEKDTEILNGIANYLFTCTDVSNVEGSDEWYDWLKSLKSRVQLKQEWKEWSEEDEDVFDYLKGLTYSRKDTKLAQRAIDWLKSIRHQKQWKPSKEQMKALHDLNLTGNISYAGQGQALIDLYNSLKELC